jgi:hypothetical protein
MFIIDSRLKLAARSRRDTRERLRRISGMASASRPIDASMYPRFKPLDDAHLTGHYIGADIR